MRIRHISLFHARIPLKKRIRHASYTRTSNESLIVRCELDDGSVGWGEGVPREYVTGETIDSAWQHLSEMNTRQLAGSLESFADVLGMLEQLVFPRPAEQRDCFGNAARCALELSILDAFSQSRKISIADCFQYVDGAESVLKSRSNVHYSAAITAMHPLKVRFRSLLVRGYGFEQCKVKVGVAGADDAHLLGLIRSYMGGATGLRLDANEAWQPEDVVRKMQPLLKHQILSLEQPVPHASVMDLKDVRRELEVPLMLDESLCSYRDAEFAIENGLCDIFNIRLSKCGGLIPSLKLAMLARQHGMQIQLGCQVGETGILSAAGRHFACHIGDLVAVEGSFDRHLVKEPLTREDLTFGYRGIGGNLRGLGLGITIDETALQRVTERSLELRVS